jgi:hypothetical protein
MLRFNVVDDNLFLMLTLRSKYKETFVAQGSKLRVKLKF